MGLRAEPVMSHKMTWLVLALAAVVTVAMPHDANAENAASRDLVAAAERDEPR
jgi:hypothetical protein